MYEMNKTIEDGLRKMLIEHGREVTRKLGDKYDFDVEEGMRYVEGIKIELKGGKGVVKCVKEKEKEKKVLPLPYCGKVVEEWCEGIRSTHGLYNQCTNEKNEETGLCERCEKEGKKNGTGKSNEGTIRERKENVEWKSVKGKKATH